MSQEVDHAWRYFRSWLTFRPWQRHSLVLMVGGTVYILLGFGYFIAGEISSHQVYSIGVALAIMPIQGWGLIFVLSGLLACLSSRWPSFDDSWGYMVLAGLSSGWSAVHLTSYIFDSAPFANIPMALIWGLAAFMWWAISGLVNPDQRRAYRDGST